MAEQLTLQAISGILAALDAAQAAIRGNVTPRLVLENLAIQVLETATTAEHTRRTVNP